jgi:hypothetical protein
MSKVEKISKKESEYCYPRVMIEFALDSNISEILLRKAR